MTLWKTLPPLLNGWRTWFPSNCLAGNIFGLGTQTRQVQYSLLPTECGVRAISAAAAKDALQWITFVAVVRRMLQLECSSLGDFLWIFFPGVRDVNVELNLILVGILEVQRLRNLMIDRHRLDTRFIKM